MASNSSGLDPCMIVVGDPCSDFVRAMVRLAREYEIEAVQCDDVYSAVAATARATGRRALVVGTMRDLAREGGRFFQIAEANALRCCCLIDRGPAIGCGGMLAAVRAKAAVVGSAQEVGPILKDWLSNGSGRTARKSLGLPNAEYRPRPGGPPRRAAALRTEGRGGPLCDLRDDDLRATEAELSALLGQGIDA